MESTEAAQPNSANSPADRRRHARYRLAVPISVHTEEGPAIVAMTLEISESGLSAVLSSSVKVGSTVQLEPVGAGTVHATVCHKVGRVYGFEFLQMTEEQTNRLRDECRRLPRYRPNRMGI
jgi:hypothetical protein